MNILDRVRLVVLLNEFQLVVNVDRLGRSKLWIIGIEEYPREWD